MAFISMTITKTKIMTGSFQRSSDLTGAPQCQQWVSLFGTIILHILHGWRGIVVSRLQSPQIRSGAGSLQNGQTRIPGGPCREPALWGLLLVMRVAAVWSARLPWPWCAPDFWAYPGGGISPRRDAVRL